MPGTGLSSNSLSVVSANLGYAAGIVQWDPAELTRLLIVGDGSVKSYNLDKEVEGYEGTFEVGGKKEYTRYDRDNAFFQGESSEAQENITDIENAVTTAMK